MKKEDKKKSLFELSSVEQEKIMRNAVAESNKAQKKLVKRYNQEFRQASA